jgi:hypothetical protein
MICHLVIELDRMKILIIFVLFVLSVINAAPSPGFGSSEERFGFGFGGRDFSSESFSRSNERFYPIGNGGYNNGPFRAFPFANR